MKELENIKNQVGIMCGRLSGPIKNQIQCFPIGSWKNEFETASKIGFELIEWIFDEVQNNPIITNEGIKEIKQLSDKFDIKINSVCADYFMTNRLFGISEFDRSKNLQVLRKLVTKCYSLEIDILEIPLVDSASMKNKKDKEEILNNLKNILLFSKEYGVQLTLETDLNAKEFNEFLLMFDSPVYANYDVGNSTSLGYNVEDELKILSHWIKNIHIKDRRLNGPTVPLGTGDVNFDTFFSNLGKINYKYNFIIQGAREDLTQKQITPYSTCEKYLKFTNEYISKYF